MEFFEMVVAIVAIGCGTKIALEIMGRGRQHPVKRVDTHERVVDVPPPVPNDPGELTARAEALLRRLATLEEIIAEDRKR